MLNNLHFLQVSEPAVVQEELTASVPTADRSAAPAAELKSRFEASKPSAEQQRSFKASTAPVAGGGRSVVVPAVVSNSNQLCKTVSNSDSRTSPTTTTNGLLGGAKSKSSWELNSISINTSCGTSNSTNSDNVKNRKSSLWENGGSKASENDSKQPEKSKGNHSNSTIIGKADVEAAIRNPDRIDNLVNSFNNKKSSSGSVEDNQRRDNNNSDGPTRNGWNGKNHVNNSFINSNILQNNLNMGEKKENVAGGNSFDVKSTAKVSGWEAKSKIRSTEKNSLEENSSNSGSTTRNNLETNSVTNSAAKNWEETNDKNSSNWKADSCKNSRMSNRAKMNSWERNSINSSSSTNSKGTKGNSWEGNSIGSSSSTNSKGTSSNSWEGNSSGESSKSSSPEPESEFLRVFAQLKGSKTLAA
jgi:hypothetical protein